MLPRLTPTNNPPEQVFATIGNRPFRIAYIVNRNVASETLSSLAKYNCSIWGGKHNLFVPTDGEAIRPDWWHLLIDYDPDKVVLVGLISEALSHSIYNHIQPFAQLQWSSNFIDELSQLRLEPLNSITMPDLLEHFRREEGVLASSNSNCVHVDIGDTPFRPFLNFITGDFVVNQFTEYYKHILGASTISCSPASIGDYVDSLLYLSERTTPLAFTANGIEHELFTNAFGSYGRCLIVSDGTVDDVFLYHVLTWFYTRKNVLIVPIFQTITERDIEAIGKWIVNKDKSTNRLTLISNSFDLHYLQSIREQLRPFAEQKRTRIQIRKCNFLIDVPDIHSYKRQLHLTIQDNRFSFSVPPIDFGNRSHSWVTEINLSPSIVNKMGYLPSKFPDLNSVLSGQKWEDRHLFRPWAGTEIRIARQKLAFVSSQRNHVATIRLPSQTELLTYLFKSYDYEVSRDEKGRYYHGMINLAGSLEAMKFLKDDKYLTLLHDRELLADKGFEVNTLIQKAKAGAKSDREQFELTLQELAGRNVFLRGVNQRCPNCNLESWYPITSINEHLVCNGCKSIFQLPVNVYCSYRLNQLFVQGLKQGAHTAILTTLLLQANRKLSLIWDAGYKAKKDNVIVDIDLLAMCDGHLVIIESKDSLPTAEPEIQEVISQLNRSIDVAKILNADMFFLSTLASTIPASIDAFIEDRNAREDSIYIGIIGRDVLLRGYWLEEEHSSRRKTIHDFQKPSPKYYNDNECFEHDSLNETAEWAPFDF